MEIFNFPDIQCFFGASKVSIFWTSTVSYESKKLHRILNPCFHDLGDTHGIIKKKSTSDVALCCPFGSAV